MLGVSFPIIYFLNKWLILLTSQAVLTTPVLLSGPLAKNWSHRPLHIFIYLEREINFLCLTKISKNLSGSILSHKSKRANKWNFPYSPLIFFWFFGHFWPNFELLWRKIEVIDPQFFLHFWNQHKILNKYADLLRNPVVNFNTLLPP